MAHNSDPDQVVLYNEAGTEIGTQTNPVYVQSDDAQPVTVQDAQASTATTTRFSGGTAIGTTASTIAAANTNRRGLIIFNEGASQDVFIKYGTGATTTSYAFKIIKAGGYWEMPQPIYTGAITAVVATGSTELQVTESEV